MKERRFSKLRGRLAEFGMSQAALSRQLGMTQASVFNKFAGNTAFTVRDIEKICDILQIPQDKIGYYFFEH